MIPTPTPFPAVNPVDMPFDMPTINLWSIADDAVQGWNMLPSNVTSLFQAILLMVLIVAALILLMKFLKNFTNEESQEG